MSDVPASFFVVIDGEVREQIPAALEERLNDRRVPFAKCGALPIAAAACVSSARHSTPGRQETGAVVDGAVFPVSTQPFAMDRNGQPTRAVWRS